MSRLYRDGTITLTAGSNIAVGVGTAWLLNVSAADCIITAGFKVYEIASVTDDTHLLIDANAVTTETGVAYEVITFATAENVRNLMVKMEEFLKDRQISLTEFTAWMAGSKTGGPNNDGKYPLTDRFGNTIMCLCPDAFSTQAGDLNASVQAISDRMTAIEANPSGYTLPKASATVLGGVKIGGGLSIDANGVISIANGGASGWAATRSYTNTSSVGNVSMETLNVSLAPALDTTATIMGSKIEVTVNLAKNWASGGYPMVAQDVISTGGVGSVDKIVGRVCQLNLTNAGGVKSALGFEAVFSAIGVDCHVDGAVGFFFPNLRVVPNIGNITRLAAFVNQDVEALVQSYGPYVNAQSVELSPPNHPGLVAGRYYASPYETLGTSTIDPGLIFFSMVHVPHRATIKKLGFNLVQNGGATGTAQVNMYQSINGQPARKVGGTGMVDIGTNGKKDIDVNFRVDPGVYWLAITTSVALGITWSNENIGMLASQMGQSDPMNAGGGLQAAAYIDGFAYGALPDALGPLKYVNTHTRPHLWIRT